jgi:hypothetical protein
VEKRNGFEEESFQKLVSLQKGRIARYKGDGLFCFEPQPNPGILYCNAGILGSYTNTIRSEEK